MREEKNREYRRCDRCIMDTSDEEIEFIQDEQGRWLCHHCRQALDFKTRLIPSQVNLQEKLDFLIAYIKAEMRDKPYDCILGLSGGLDSSYLALKVKDLGLRALCVHVDGGWNTPEAVANIKSIVSYTGFELWEHKADFGEMADLQRAFFYSGVVNCDAPQDYLFFSVLAEKALKSSIRFLITGSNWESESILPRWGWDAMDLNQLLDIHARFGQRELKSLPRVDFFRLHFFYPLAARQRKIPLLNFLPYNTKEAKEELIRRVGWRPYERKHGESYLTRFYQNYFLPTKFGYDKRLAHLSSLVIAGEITREEALLKMQEPLYDEAMLTEDKRIVLERLELSEAQWDSIMQIPEKSFREYDNWEAFYELRASMHRQNPIYTYIAPGFSPEMLG